MLGEHTSQVLRELLGMSPEAVATLRDEGVIGPSTKTPSA
jgi:crotonobetainyl-CoA:carnitine CoA-transferase CaiB-like acyl-CoA transferase